MQKIKLLALDLDGTLIPDLGVPIAQKDIEAVERARAAGVFVTIATGRIFKTVEQWVDTLGIDMPVILCNGADIRDATRSWFRDGIPAAQIRAVMDAYSGLGMKRYAFSDNQIYCTKEDYYKPLFDKWGKGEGSMPVVVCDTEDALYDALHTDVDKMLVWTTNAEGVDELVRIAQTFSDRFSVVRGEERNVEFNRKGVSKGSGLRHLAKLLDIPMDAVMAIGDGGNDVEMLREAGLGVAMGNAMREAKDAADHITSHVRDCGVAAAIERFILDTK